MKNQINAKAADHICAVISGVKPTDTKLEAALKVLQTMKNAGFKGRAMKEAEAIVERIRAQQT